MFAMFLSKNIITKVLSLALGMSFVLGGVSANADTYKGQLTNQMIQNYTRCNGQYPTAVYVPYGRCKSYVNGSTWNLDLDGACRYYYGGHNVWAWYWGYGYQSGGNCFVR